MMSKFKDSSTPMRFVNGLKTAVAAIALLAVVSGADAATIVDTKLAQFGLEPRLTCDKWAKPWPGAKICVGTGRTEFLQHEFHLLVEEPEPGLLCEKFSRNRPLLPLPRQLPLA